MVRRRQRGQTLVELALVMPLFVMVLAGIIILGVGVFYQQQVTNAAREAARYAAIHSATAQCPTVPHLPYDPQGANKPLSYVRCDRPENGWPFMSGAARDAVFGMDRGALRVTACWSGYRSAGGSGSWDAWVPGEYDLASPPIVVSDTDSVFVQCSIGGVDPTTDTDALPCSGTIATTDQGSAVSEAPGRPVANTVTAYACYVWEPPLAGFLLIPDQVALRGVITEAIQRQQ
jgi:Flp pilus assembly protein TadG